MANALPAPPPSPPKLTDCVVGYRGRQSRVTHSAHNIRGALSHGDHAMGIAPMKVLHKHNNNDDDNNNNNNNMHWRTRLGDNICAVQPTFWASDSLNCFPFIFHGRQLAPNRCNLGRLEGRCGTVVVQTQLPPQWGTAD